MAADENGRQPGSPNQPSTGYLLCPPISPFLQLVHLAKHRWIIERDYEELKQELRSWATTKRRGWKVASIITPRYASPGLCHSFPRSGRTESFFSPSAHQYRQSWTSSARAVARLPATRLVRRIPSPSRGRHNPRSITTLRMVLAPSSDHRRDRSVPFLWLAFGLILSIDIRIYHTRGRPGYGLARSSTNRSTVPLASVSRKRCNANSLVNLLAQTAFALPAILITEHARLAQAIAAQPVWAKQAGSAPCKWR